METRWILLASLIAIIGCHRDPSGLQEISGYVTFEKQPLQLGSIQFASDENPPLPTGGALIKSGAYVVSRAHGLLPGRYRVRISSPATVPTKPVDSKLMHYETSGGERIPEEFNSASQQLVSVKAGEVNRFDFQIP